MAVSEIPMLSRGDSVYLWRYEGSVRSYRGWHFTANDSGCRALLAILKALESTDIKSRTVVLSVPGTEELEVPSCRLPHVAATKLRLTSVDEPRDRWQVESHGDVVSLTFGPEGAGKFAHAVEDVSRGIGDYFIGTDPNRLWVWWRVSGDAQ